MVLREANKIVSSPPEMQQALTQTKSPQCLSSKFDSLLDGWLS